MGEVVKIPKGHRYITSEFIPKTPSNVLYMKGRCGSGGTYTEIVEPRNSVIFVPYQKLAEQKALKHKEILEVSAGVTVTDIMSYILSYKGHLKIMSTYNGVTKVYEALSRCGMLGDFFYLVDEYHITLLDSSFRPEVMDLLFKTVSKLKDVTYMSATPVPRRFLHPNLRKIDTFEVKWGDKILPDFDLVYTNSYISYVRDIIKSHLKSDKTNNLHLFLNSVSAISRILKDLMLDPEDVAVNCSLGETDGISENQEKLGEKYIISKDISKPKRINLYTSVAFLGVDIDDVNDPEVMVVVSNSSVNLTLCPDMVLKQIVGRVRDERFAMKNVTIVAQLADIEHEVYKTYSEYSASLKSPISKLKTMIKKYNDKSELYRENKEFNPSGSALEFYTVDETNNTVEYSYTKELAFRFAAHLNYNVYSNKELFETALSKAGFFMLAKNTVNISKDSKIKSETPVAFLDAAWSYYHECDIIDNAGEDEDITENLKKVRMLVKSKPLLPSLRKYVTIDEIMSENYTMKEAGYLMLERKEIENLELSRSKVATCVAAAFNIGEVYTTAQIETLFGNIFKKLGLNYEVKKGMIGKFFNKISKTTKIKGKTERVTILTEMIDPNLKLDMLDYNADRFHMSERDLEGMSGVENIEFLFNTAMYLDEDDLSRVGSSVSKAKELLDKKKAYVLNSMTRDTVRNKAMKKAIKPNKVYTERVLKKEVGLISVMYKLNVPPEDWRSVVETIYDIEEVAKSKGKNKKFKILYKQ